MERPLQDTRAVVWVSWITQQSGRSALNPVEGARVCLVLSPPDTPPLWGSAEGHSGRSSATTGAQRQPIREEGILTAVESEVYVPRCSVFTLVL